VEQCGTRRRDRSKLQQAHHAHALTPGNFSSFPYMHYPYQCSWKRATQAVQRNPTTFQHPIARRVAMVVIVKEFGCWNSHTVALIWKGTKRVALRMPHEPAVDKYCESLHAPGTRRNFHTCAYKQEGPELSHHLQVLMITMACCNKWLHLVITIFIYYIYL